MQTQIVRTCRVCGHKQAAAIRLQLANGRPFNDLAREYQLEPAELWRCRLQHIEDPFKLYNFLDASAEKARALDAARIHPLILAQVDHDPQ